MNSRDHKILHKFADIPAIASTGHSLVKNDTYGINHTIAYDQDTLTLPQIKMMHDNWVKKYDNPKTHATPINSPSVEEVAHLDRWDTPVIKNPNTKRVLTKRDIYRYYSDPNVKKTLFKQIHGAPIIVRQAMSPGESWIKRSPIIYKNTGDPNDPEDLQYYIERRHVEFHPTLSSNTDKLVVDVDPGASITMDETKKVVKYLENMIKNLSYVKDVDIQFSGHRGFYVWGYLQSTMNIDSVREKLKRLFAPIQNMNGVKVSLRANAGAKVVRIDLSPMKKLGSVRAEGSLDYRTGYVSTKVPSHTLSSFDPERDATIDTSSLKPAYSYRDESLI